jgi:hypothetical protein
VTGSGPAMFARFAYPPNALGYCGPADPQALIEHLADQDQDEALRAAAMRFEGAWPYLALIATANGIRDPLDARVVEAYWIGNPLLDGVDMRTLGDSVEERFRRRAGRSWERLAAPVYGGARPHHSFHVFGVYPWLGLIRSGVVDAPLHVLDRCRIRWAQVEALAGDRAVVRGRPLEWDGHGLVLGAPRHEQVVVGEGGLSLTPSLQVGDWCALHWDWVCARLSVDQLSRLRWWTRHTLGVVNGTPYPAPAAVLA